MHEKKMRIVVYRMTGRRDDICGLRHGNLRETSSVGVLRSTCYVKK